MATVEYLLNDNSRGGGQAHDSSFPTQTLAEEAAEKFLRENIEAPSVSISRLVTVAGQVVEDEIISVVERDDLLEEDKFMSENHQPSGKNSNCLDGMCCPDCGNEDELLIAATMFVSVRDDGTDPYVGTFEDHSQDWDDNSACKCPECQHVGTVGEFKGKDPEDLLAEWQWNGRTVRDIEKRIENIIFIVPQKNKEWAYTVPDDCRGKISYVASTNPVNSLDEIHESVEILAVDRAGEALVCRGTIHTYYDAEGEKFIVMPVGEAKTLWAQYKEQNNNSHERDDVVGRQHDADLAGALDSCLTQIYQMKGLFDDSDGAIQNAIDDAELVLQAHRTSTTAPRACMLILPPCRP